MATKTAAGHDTTTFFNDLPIGSSTVSTDGEEATYWPGLREVNKYPDPLQNPGTRFATEHLVESPAPAVTPLIRLRRQGTTARRFQVLQQWEGVVTRVDGDWFEADLRDLTKSNNPMEVAELPFAEISPADKPMIRPGCVFYWIIGYETRSGGQVSRTSEIRVRRAPQWTQRKLDALKLRARELFTLEGEDGEKAAQPG